MTEKIINVLDPEILGKRFRGAEPFDHVVIENFMNEEFAKKIAENFPKVEEKKWWMYDNPLEKKLAFNDVASLHPSFTSFFNHVNSNVFMQWLEVLTGLKNLKPDPLLNGGGLHCIRRGGKLDVHEDFNIHKGLNMLRKVNLIVYLNEDWQEEWGGHLEIWDREMTKLHRKVSPVFNTAIIFRTDMESNHGHPHPLNCPENRTRNSLATYYYIQDSNIDKIPYKSTIYKKLPNVEDGLDELREIRSKGRLNDMVGGKDA